MSLTVSGLIEVRRRPRCSGVLDRVVVVVVVSQISLSSISLGGRGLLPRAAAEDDERGVAKGGVATVARGVDRDRTKEVDSLTRSVATQ